MKTIIIIFICIILFDYTVYSSEAYTINKNDVSVLKTNNTINSDIFTDVNGDGWGYFWITLAISAIGVYSIYGIAAGFITVAVVYFISNNNKKAMKRAIWGCIIGCLIGALIRVLTLL